MTTTQPYVCNTGVDMNMWSQEQQVYCCASAGLCALEPTQPPLTALPTQPPTPPIMPGTPHPLLMIAMRASPIGSLAGASRRSSGAARTQERAAHSRAEVVLEHDCSSAA